MPKNANRTGYTKNIKKRFAIPQKLKKEIKQNAGFVLVVRMS